MANCGNCRKDGFVRVSQFVLLRFESFVFIFTSFSFFLNPNAIAIACFWLGMPERSVSFAIYIINIACWLQLPLPWPLG